MEPGEKSYHEILRSAVEKSRLNKKEIAERVGIHSTYIGKLLKPDADPASDLTNENLEKILGIPAGLLRASAYKHAIPPELMPIIVDDYCLNNGIVPVSQNRRHPGGSDSKRQLIVRADRKIRRLNRMFCQKKHGGEIPIELYPECAGCKVEQSKQRANVKAFSGHAGM